MIKYIAHSSCKLIH